MGWAFHRAVGRTARVRRLAIRAASQPITSATADGRRRLSTRRLAGRYCTPSADSQADPINVDMMMSGFFPRRSNA